MKNRLRVRRVELDVTQFEIARKSGIGETRLSRIENGLIDPLDHERAALARVLDTTEDVLFPELAASTPAEGEAAR